MSILVIFVICLTGVVVGAVWLRRKIRPQRSGGRSADLDNSLGIGRQQLSSADVSSAPHDSEAGPKSEELAGNTDVLLNKVSELEAVGFEETQDLITAGEFAINPEDDPEDLPVQSIEGAESERAAKIGVTDVRHADLSQVKNAHRSLEGTSPDVGEPQCSFDRENANSGSVELTNPAETLIAAARESKGVSDDLHPEIGEPQVPSFIETGGPAVIGLGPTHAADGMGAGVAPAKAPPIDLEPRKFRPRPRIQRAKPAERERQSTVRPRDIAIERALPIELQLLTQLGGTYRLSLVLRKRHAMPNHVIVQSAGVEFHLTAIGRKWYQGVSPADIGKLLLEGIRWTSSSTGLLDQWSLPGRQLYVLSPREELDLSGFVSTNRLVIGEAHVVLCVEAIAPKVRELLTETCDSQFKEVTGHGIPGGWVAYTHIFPTKSLPVGTTADILDALRPTPDLDIKLRGGIRIERSVWLSGYPPEIKIVGDVSRAQFKLIDGQPVSVTNGLVLFNSCSDTPGPHVVEIDGKTRRYSIAEATEGWENWVPYSFATPNCSGAKPTEWTICGALVKPGDVTSMYQLFAPAANPILIGAIPGQIKYCVVRNDVRLEMCPVVLPFDPVWAVPANVLHANKVKAKIRIVGPDLRPPTNLTLKPGQVSKQVVWWYTAILDCARKGLTIEPHTEAVSRLWSDYKKIAKRLRRSHNQ